MLQFIKLKKAFLIAVVLGMISFASYGIYSIAHAIAASGPPVTSGDNTVAINALVPASDKQDSGICSPLGCAGCGGCSNSLYQQVTTIAYDPYLSE